MAEKSINDSINSIDTIAQAQTDMCKGYANGSLGILVSGFMWLISAIVAYQYSENKSVWALLIGGMLIHPVSLLLYKIIGLKGNHTKGNPLGNLAMEGTFFMIMCLPIAYGLSLQNTQWFFQAMLLIIGGRYLTFSTIYGTKIYWILGATLGVAAYILFRFNMPSFVTLLTGSAIEISFGLFMFLSFRRNNKNG